MKKLNLCLCASSLFSPVASAIPDRQARNDGFVPNESLQRYLQTLGDKLAAVSHRPAVDWHFTVVDSAVINAFAIPGGYGDNPRDGFADSRSCFRADGVSRIRVGVFPNF